MSVKIPSVAPRESSVMMMAFSGRMKLPKTSAMRMKVASTT